MSNSTVCLSFDFDALSVWLAYERVTPAKLNRGSTGRGHRIAMLDELIGHCLDAGARFARMGDIAQRLG